MSKLAVFDCDGTLVDGQAGICEAMEATFAKAGLPAPGRVAIRRAVGLSLPQAVRRLLPNGDDATLRALVDGYKQAFRSARVDGRLAQPLFEGIAPLLDRLQAAGWQLAVATGMSLRGLEHVLATHGLTGRFCSLQTADRHPSKPHPAMLEAALFECAADPARAVMIGDTVFDMQMARSMRVRAVGVCWGYHEDSELREAGGEWVAPSPAELGDYLLR